MLFTNPVHGNFAKDPAVVHFHGMYYLYYTVHPTPDRYGVGIAASPDMESWTIIGELPQDTPAERNGSAAPAAIVLNDRVHLFYQTYGTWRTDALSHAVSDDGVHFEKNPENPVYAPPATWCCGRAIDADVCIFDGKLFMYYATRDHEMRQQKIGGAWAALDSGFGRVAWTALADQTLLHPELTWEGECIEAPATIVEQGRIYMFYGGAYNCKPQQIGCAVSDDGVFFRRLFVQPLIPCGAPDRWNASESGHPYAFRDDDGRAYLFYQGSPDGGKTWYITRCEIGFENGIPVILTPGDDTAKDQL